jgi:fructokinase
MPTQTAALSRPFRILGVGELLWDLLPAGPQLGGAPANFALHARALGADAALVSRVGRDERGCAALLRLAAAGLPTGLIQRDASAPTGTVGVTLGDDGQPAYTIHEGVAWDRLEATPEALAAVAAADAVCFGTLAQRDPRARAAVQRLVSAAPTGALRIFDLNLRQHFHAPAVIEASLRLANVLKVNDAEWPVLAAQFGLAGDLRAQVAALAGCFGLRVVALTRGAAGSLLLADGVWAEDPGMPVKVVDTIGAGDAFTAAMTLALLAGWPATKVNAMAGELARFVCGHAGATPVLPPGFAAQFLETRRP